MTKEEKQTAWSIEELIALTDEVQNASVDYRGKDFDFLFCELVEDEEPKMGAIPEDADDDEKMAHYSKIGNQRIVAMIEKANKKKQRAVIHPGKKAKRGKVTNQQIGFYHQKGKGNLPVREWFGISKQAELDSIKMVEMRIEQELNRA